jgi:hypothetical protein
MEHDAEGSLDFSEDSSVSASCVTTSSAESVPECLQSSVITGFKTLTPSVTTGRSLTLPGVTTGHNSPTSLSVTTERLLRRNDEDSLIQSNIERTGHLVDVAFIFHFILDLFEFVFLTDTPIFFL